MKNIKKALLWFVFVCFGVFAACVGIQAVLGLYFAAKVEAAEITPEYRLKEREVRALERIAAHVEDIGAQLGNVCFDLPPLPLCKPRPLSAVKP